MEMEVATGYKKLESAQEKPQVDELYTYIPIVLGENASSPEYKHETDAGADLRASESGVINPGEFKMVPTGVSMAIPNTIYGHIQSRSGLASKRGIFSLTGTIDAGFRGQIFVVLGNFGKESFEYEVGDRIAQIVFHEFIHAMFTETDTLPESDRGESGYGSTGVK